MEDYKITYASQPSGECYVFVNGKFYGQCDDRKEAVEYAKELKEEFEKQKESTK